MSLYVTIFTTCILLVNSETYTYRAPIQNFNLGECVTLQAITHFKHNGSESITWKRDTKLLKTNTRLKLSRTSLSITALHRDDHAYYQVTVADPSTRITEITDIWLNVKECNVNQKENPSESITSCKKLCEDKCKKEWSYVPGTSSKCLQYFSIPKSWPKASEHCQSIGGELVSIKTRNENEFVGDMLQTAVGGWTGLNDRSKEAVYIWNFQSKNTPSFYTWGANEPSNYNKGCNIENCVVLKKANGRWDDVVCVSFRTFVCEVDLTYNATDDKANWRCSAKRCYKHVNSFLVWKDALKRCQQLHSSGQLAVINNKDENRLVQSLINKGDVWIGMNDIWEAGFYTWNTAVGRENKASYKNWDSKEPNDMFYQPFAPKCPGEDCVQIKKFSGIVTWHDLSCETKLPYVCEKVRDRAFSTGAFVGIGIGSVILISVIAGLIHAAYEKHTRTAVKDIIKAAYEEDISMREKTKKQFTFREIARRFMPVVKID